MTGATGLVGRALVRSLQKDGIEVASFSRDPSKLPASEHGRRWPPRADDVALDAVVHLLGEPVAGRWSDAKKKAIVSSRIDGTRLLVDAIRALPPAERPRVLVSASAIGVYGDRGDEELREDASVAHDFLADVCAGWEREALAAESLGVRVVCVRIGLVMSHEGGALKAMLLPFRMGLGGSMGPGTQWWPWIHLDDLVGLVRFAIDHDTLRGPVNATAPTPVRQREFAATLARVLGRPAFIPAPSFALRTALSGFAEELLASRRVVPFAAQSAGFSFRFRELEPALRDAAVR
ncbi:MAG: TIGR01777 family oxidoreductase [Sandaracinaceae bacterium]|nr:TIGR01777 family oxidoreductase [Sandaracinaceae bacterium]